jgi:hypothetical protein
MQYVTPMLSRIIDKVYLGKNEINIEFNLRFDESFIKHNGETAIIKK